MSAFRRQVAGLFVQFSSALFLATQAFLAPRFLGASNFGLAHVALALPLLIQAVLETVLFALNIRWIVTDDADQGIARVSRMWRDSARIALLGTVAVAAYLLILLRHVPPSRLVPLAVVSALFLPILVLATIAMAVGFALRRYGDIIAAYCCASIVTGGGLYLIRHRGAGAFVALLLLNQVVMFAVMIRRAAVRSYLVRVARAPAANAAPCRWLLDYFPVLTGRLTLLLLTSGIMLLASWSLDPTDVAGLKVSLTILTAGTYMLPISIPVLQGAWTDENRDHVRRRRALRFMATLFAVACVITAGFVLFGPTARAIILHESLTMHRRFDYIFWSFPLYVLIAPATAYLVATHRTWILARGFVAALVWVAVVAALGRIEWTVLGGSAAFVLSVMTFYAANGSRRDADFAPSDEPHKLDSRESNTMGR